MITRKNHQATADVLKAKRGRISLSELAAWINHGEYNSDYDLAQYAAAETIVSIAHGMADVFANDNPRFNRDKFLAACGL